MAGTVCTFIQCNPYYGLPWHSPDFGDITSRGLASTLVGHEDKLHLVTWLKAHTVLHFRHMKE
jgi:hypothetical protein